MKKQIIAFLLLWVIGAQLIVHFGYTKAQAKVIPNEAIRLRILANSDDEKDQALKRKVRDAVKTQIDTWVAELTSIDEARTVIQNHIPELEQIVASVLKTEGSQQSYNVSFGKHVKFPTKLYGNFLYPAGEYEAVLVTLGKGEGANWWCVLFPPLCFLDFSSGTAVRKEKPAKIKEDQTVQPQVTETAVATTIEIQKPKTKQSKPKIKEIYDLHKQEKLMKQTEHVYAKKIVAQEVPKEEEVKVKFFLVEAFTSLFSK